MRAALERAIAQLKEPPAIEEPSDRDARESIHLDQDRKGIPGSPDLARTIFEKIRQAKVIVADVTAVGRSSSTGPETPPKKLINPNVAIELGYALHAVGDQGLLMVLNTHYGSRDDLPFDLKHKAGPIEFNLSPDATKDAIETEGKRLATVLVAALRACLSASEPAASDSSKFAETPPAHSKAIYFEAGAALARDDKTAFHFPYDKAFYLRLIPTSPLEKPLLLSTLRQAAQRDLVPLALRRHTMLYGLNEHGVLAFERASLSLEKQRAATTASIKAFTQAFTNGELWGVSSDLVNTERHAFGFVPGTLFEQTYYHVLRACLWFSQTILKINAPFVVEAGGVGLRDVRIAVKNWVEPFSEPIHRDTYQLRRVLTKTDTPAVDAFLLEFFEGLYDLAGHVRPAESNSFPPGPPQ